MARRNNGGRGTGQAARNWRSDRQSGGSGGGQSQRGRSGTGRGQFAGVGPRDFQRSPDLIGDEVVIVLTADPDIDASDITVVVDDDGTVTLIGTVDTDEDAQRAADVASCVPGVTDVRNQLNVGMGGGGSGRQLQDRSAGAGRSGGGVFAGR